jgi:hypothetical protein
LQSQLAELWAQQAAQEEAHRQQLAAQQEAHRRQLEAVQEHSAREMKEFASFFQGLEIPGFRCPPLPPVMFAPPPVLAPPPVSSPLGTPVSFYQSIYCFFLCGHPAITNEIASPLCSNSRRVQTRLHMAILQAMCGRLARLPLSHNSRGQVAFLLGLRTRGPPGGLATLRLPSRLDPGGRTPAHRKSTVLVAFMAS